MPSPSTAKPQEPTDEVKTPELRDLAGNLSPEAMRLWPQLLAFSRFLTKRTLHDYNGRQPHAPSPHTPSYRHDDDEEDIVGTFLFSLLMAGALYRTSINHDLLNLTTDNVILQGRWFQIDAFKPNKPCAVSPKNTRRPKRRNLQIRFPLPVPTRCLLYRVAMFSKLRVGTQDPDDFIPSHKFEFLPDQPLFSVRIRKKKNFFHDWLTHRFVEFHETRDPSLSFHQGMGNCSPAPEHWPPSWKEIKNACQANLLSTLPPWVVAGLSRRWMSRPSTIWDIERVLLDKYHPSVSIPADDKDPAPLEGMSAPLSARPARPTPSRLPDRLKVAYTEVNRLLNATTREPLRATKSTLLKEVNAILATLSPQVIAADPSIPLDDWPLYDNARLLFLWLQSLIASPRSLNTVRLYFFNLLLFIYEKFGRTPLSEVKTPATLVHIVAECMQYYDNPESQRNVKKSFQSFFQHATLQGVLPPICWNDQELWVYRDAEDRPVFTYRDIDYLLTHIMSEATSGDYSEVHATRLQSFFILCFYAGLRREEATLLTVADFEEGPETLLWVRHSKTKAGIRVIPLSLLVPEKERAILHRQYRTARALASGRATSEIPLLPSDEGTFCRPDLFGEWASTLMKRYLGAGSAHDLRHSFATWFLVRWYLTFHPIPNAKLPKAFLPHIFSQHALKPFRQLFLRPSCPGSRKGATAVTRPLFALQTLIGHACPEITLSVYAHSLDWIYYLHLLRSGSPQGRHLDFPSTLTFQQVAPLLLLTPASLYARRKKRQPVPRTLDEVMIEQMVTLRLCDTVHPRSRLIE